MYNITLLSSFHKNLGKCNPNELFKIIKKIGPEIIFEELSIGTFSNVYSDGYIPSTIEAITIKKYLRDYSIKHFPVDTYPIKETELFSGSDKILQSSLEYNKLWREQVLLVAKYGFNFLNSNTCIELFDKIRTIEQNVLLQLNNEKLSREFKSEIGLHEKRENEMLRNIYEYSKQNPFNKALFICGATHRRPIIQKVQDFEKRGNPKLNWTFYEGHL
ncbi:hypothetical protein ED312_10310 [Sinomicrobium pectinilyticum]|uniref:Uncharacterized protein n=1 Tax=Sinomicrobium pectinilyticum TaxID=1084421 RepID=A0A3N0EH34_SINP1|nr:hypothetical protein [Sinomicrobium pectinilyticum]RNL87196.1 hypothetical protein ED312_10310 [Sinomicrobium pectinilyticum]